MNRTMTMLTAAAGTALAAQTPAAAEDYTLRANGEVTFINGDDPDALSGTFAVQLSSELEPGIQVGWVELLALDDGNAQIIGGSMGGGYFVRESEGVYIGYGKKQWIDERVASFDFSASGTSISDGEIDFSTLPPE